MAYVNSARAGRLGRRGASLACAFAVVVGCLTALKASPASAQRTHDFMLDLQPEGTFALIDYYGTGGQLTLEHRKRMYGPSNDWMVAASIVPAYPLGEANVRAELRVLFLALGMSAGYRAVWRELEFERDPNGYCLRCDRSGRREVDKLFGASPGSDGWGFGEIRAQLSMPFNDSFVGQSTVALRYEDRNDRSFDWFYTSVYDRGVAGRWETTFFLKHRDFGGIGPYVQLLELPRNGKHVSQWAFGFNAVTRLKLLRDDDLLLLTFLTRPGDDSYGQHSYYAPIRALLIYRVILAL